VYAPQRLDISRRLDPEPILSQFNNSGSLETATIVPAAMPW
jgi:hypothetical protein